MKNVIKLIYAALFVTIIGFAIISCSGKKEGGGSGGSSSSGSAVKSVDDMAVKLMYNSGNWAKEDDSSTYFIFSPGRPMESGLIFRQNYMDVCYFSPWEVSGSKVTGKTITGEQIVFDVKFINDEKITISGLTGDKAAANGTYCSGY